MDQQDSVVGNELSIPETSSTPFGETDSIPDYVDQHPSYIVGIGASAGGLEALEAFFSRMPADSGMAFVVVQHLSPDFKSLMSELLSRHTDMPIYRVRNGMKVEPNSLYLLPPKKDMVISNGVFLLTDKDPSQSLTLPIDIFFRSLAEDARERAIAIVLSGTGSDGSRGIRTIHEAGGLVLVQDERSAKFDGMPRSAMATGVADLVLPAETMPEALLKYAKHPIAARLAAPPPLVAGQPGEKSSALERLFDQLQAGYGIDFGAYKGTTVGRRIERRLLLRQIRDLDDYVNLLHDDRDELEALYRDLLIGVTRFFRDPDAYAALEARVIPKLVSGRIGEEGLRIWVAGCATGEEAYSLAILLSEALVKRNLPPNFKIFATDVHRESLDFASAGLYPEASVADMSPERLQRYFTYQEGQYKISADLRRQVVFAPQNLLKDPPFTKIDLLSCRNLLIYFKPAAQRKILSLFHFALNNSGSLFLGPSETLGELYDEFDTIDQHWKLFVKRKDVRQTGGLGITLAPTLSQLKAVTTPSPLRIPPPNDLRLMRAYDALLDRFIPASLLVNEHLEMVHTFGDAGKYLKPPSGRATLDTLQLVLDDLRMPVGTGIQKALKDRNPVSYRGVRVRTSTGEEEMVQVTIEPLPERGSDSLFLFVAFETMRKREAVVAHLEEYEADQQFKQRITDLEQELNYSREHLSATIEELETSNEELQATNEELVASNEELQSTNEELHSVNEELYSVNAEFQNKIDELTQLTNDIDNLLRATDIGTVFLDTQLRIRKLTPAIGKSFNLLPQDVGRPIEHISANIEYPALLEELRQVVDNGQLIEREVRNRDGAWLLMRLLPYSTDTGAIEGVVVTFTDITSLRMAQEEQRQVEANFRQMVDFVSAIFWLTSSDSQHIYYVSPAYERIWHRSLEDLCHDPASWLDGVHPEDRERLRQSLADRAPHEAWEMQYRIVWPDGTQRWIRDRRYPVQNSNGQAIRLAGISMDVTGLRATERQLELTQLAVDNAGDMVLWMNNTGHLMYVNEAACRTLGYTKDQLMGKPMWEIDAGRNPANWPAFRESLERDGRSTVETHFTTRTHKTFATEVQSIHLQHEHEGYVCSIARDVSGRQQAAQAMQHYAHELERANESLRLHNRELDEFAHLASHDLKEPLRAILTFSQLLEQDLGGSLPEEAHRDLNFITSAAERMQRLINDLLALSRTGRADMNRSEVPLRSCVDSALEALAVRLQETEAEVQIGPLPQVVGDSTMLTQLYQNLIGNALKFKGAEKPVVSIGGERKGSEWVYWVRDNGIGIKPEYADKVFQPFRRVHARPELEGTGIGLAICRRVVERHRGRIWVESEPGKGACFHFTLQEGA